MARVIPGYTINALVAANFDNLSIYAGRDQEGAAALYATGSYTVSTTPGGVSKPDQLFSSVTVQLTPAQATAIRTFITNNLVGPANEQEGL